MNCEDLENLTGGPVVRSVADRWISSRLHAALAASRRAIETYRFDLYANTLYEFVWHEYCDWYLELTKPTLWDEHTPPEEALGTRRTLLGILEALLRIAHPAIPFITDTIWREVAPRLGNQGQTIMNQPFPQLSDFQPDAEADQAIDWLKGVVDGVRNIRGEAGIKPGVEIELLLQSGDDGDRRLAAGTDTLLKRLAKVTTIRWLGDKERPPPNALAVVGELKVMVPLAGLIDVEGEKVRLGKEIEKKKADLKRVRSKLDNPNFMGKAPAEVVAKEEAKARDVGASLALLEDQLEALSALE